MRSIQIILGSMLVATAAAAQPSAPDFAHDQGPRDGVAPDRVASPTDDTVRPFEVVHFGFASAALDNVDRAQLTAGAEWLAANPGHRLVIEGYTDRSGSAAYNDRLASARARAVRTALIGAGANPERLVVAVYGEAFATDARAASRRVVVYATPDKRPAK